MAHECEYLMMLVRLFSTLVMVNFGMVEKSTSALTCTLFFFFFFWHYVQFYWKRIWMSFSLLPKRFKYFIWMCFLKKSFDWKKKKRSLIKTHAIDGRSDHTLDWIKLETMNVYFIILIVDHIIIFFNTMIILSVQNHIIYFSN